MRLILWFVGEGVDDELHTCQKSCNRALNGNGSINVTRNTIVEIYELALKSFSPAIF
jgi:hypothetical protein